MKKFAANYVISESGSLLKNGILIAGDDGTVSEIIDTKGDLDEMAQLTFHNGILMTNNLFIRKSAINSEKNELSQFVSLQIRSFSQLTTFEIIDIAQKTQTEFPELKIAQIIAAIFSILDSSFNKDRQAGVFLLIHSDLIGMHFKPQSRLKRIL